MSEETKKTEEQVEATKVEKTEATAPVETKPAATHVVEEEKVEEVKVSPEEFLENFDWHKYEEGIEAVDEENIKAF